MPKNLQAYKLGVTIDANAARALGALRDVDRQAGKTASSLGSVKNSASGMFSSLGSLAGGVATAVGTLTGGLLTSAITSTVGAVGGALKDAAMQGIAFNSRVEGATISLKRLLGTTEAATRHIEELKIAATQAPVGFSSLLKLDQLLQNVKFSAEGLPSLLRDASRGIALLAGPDDLEGRMERITAQLAQMSTKGKAQAEELNILAENLIPVYDLLANATGLSTRRLQELASKGALKGKETATLILQELAKESKKVGSEIDNSYGVLLSNIQDKQEQLAGKGTQRLFAATKEGMQALLSQSDAADKLAEGLDNATGKAIDFGKGVLESIRSGNFATAGLQMAEGVVSGVKSASGKLYDQGKAVANEVWTGIKQEAGINSPAENFKPLGLAMAEGVAVGIRSGEGIISETLNQIVEDAINAALSVTQRRSLSGLRKLTKAEPEFLAALKSGAEARGWDADSLLNLMALETAQTFRKDIRGGYKNQYTGLIQFGPAARKDVGLPLDTAAAQKHLASISATQQLDYVFKYLEQKERASGVKLDSLAKLYAAVGAGSVSRNDQTTVFRQGGFREGDFRSTRRISGAGYSANQPWDFNKDGQIQQWEFGAAASARLGAGEKFSVSGKAVEVRATRTAPLPVMIVDNRAVNAGTIHAGVGLVPFSDVTPAQLGGVSGSGVAAVNLPVGGPSLFKPAASNVVSLADYKTQTQAEARASITRRNDAPPLFADRNIGVADANGEPVQGRASQYATAGLKAAGDEAKDLGTGAFKQLGAGVGSMVQDFVLLGETGPAALKKITAQVLASLSAEAAVKSIYYLAEGFANLFTNPAKASGYFTAAAIMGGVAVAAGVGGRALAGKQDKGQISEEQRRQAQINNVASEGYAGNRFERREHGGNVYAGRSYLLGERRAEVVEFPANGYVHPSVNEYQRKRADLERTRAAFAGQSLDGFFGRHFTKLIAQLDAQFARLEAVKGDDVFLRVMDRNARAVARTTVNALDADDQLSSRLGRRIVA